MSTKTPQQKTVTKDVQNREDIDDVLERRSWNYGFIGRDNEGRFHHVDRKSEKIVVTEHGFRRDDSGAVPVYRVRGPVLHAQATEDGDTLKQWLNFIEGGCGWDDRPISAVDQIQEIVEDGVR